MYRDIRRILQVENVAKNMVILRRNEKRNIHNNSEKDITKVVSVL
jgi:hypothetical protein